MKNLISLAWLLLLPFYAEATTVNALKAGAKNDGKTLNTNAISKAIDKLSSQGGGTLYFPSGTYLTGPIRLQSNITLDLDAGAVLSFSDHFDLYMPYVEMRYEGVVMKSFHPLIYAYEAENITIKGRGRLEGNGRAWWEETWRLETAFYKGELQDAEPTKYQQAWLDANPGFSVEPQSDWKNTLARHWFRPPFIQLYKCKNILIEGLHIANSPFWTVNPEFCDNLTIQGLTIVNPNSPNTDGINPESCTNVHISNCHISVGDDCITIKSGRDLQGRQYAAPCENITITNCTMLSGHGGVVIGSEMSGDVRKITISNCVFDGTDRGIRLKSTRGRGGVVEEIRVSNIVMKNIQKEAVILNLFYSRVPQEPVTERTPIFRNIHISGMTGSEVKSAGSILGIPEMPISNISIEDVNIQAESGFSVQDARDIQLRNICIDTQKGPIVQCKDAAELYLSNIRSSKPLAEAALLRMENVSDVFIEGCFPLPGSKAFLELSGAESSRVILKNNFIERIEQPYLIHEMVDSAALVY